MVDTLNWLGVTQVASDRHTTEAREGDVEMNAISWEE